MTLEQLNSCSLQQAEKWFEQSCCAKNWIHKMATARPFANTNELSNYARFVWDNFMLESDYLEAFEGHPMIGDLSSLREKYANTSAHAGEEQSGAQQADEVTLLELKRLNQQYFEQNGFIFIICASGLSAHAMLTELNKRINNNTSQELAIAAEEQIKITLLRLGKFLSSASEMR